MFLIVWKVIFLKKDNQTIINQFSTNCHNIYILTVAYARVILAHARVEVENVRKCKCGIIKRRPKKAINKLAYPIIGSLLLVMLNNIIDSVWVAGLGSDPLAAIGYITPLFMILVGVGNGIGAGANSLISRFIGAKDKKGADSATAHSLILSIIISIGFMVLFIAILGPILKIMGASEVLNYCKEYEVVLFIWTFSLIIPTIIGGIFRAEGDVNRATLPLAVTAIANMILDPIFIYGLNQGLAGAALATGIAGLIGLLMQIYWIYVKKNTYLSYSLKNFKNNMKMYADILAVGIPASLEQLIIAILAIIVNFLLTVVAGTTAVAVYTAGWRIISVGIIPAVGVGTAAVTVAGVSYGARNYDKIKTTVRYAVKLGFIVSLITCILIHVFAGQIAYIFSYSSNSSQLAPLITKFLQLMCLFVLFVPFGATAANVFQGLGKGTVSLGLTIIRAFILVLLFAYLFAFPLGLGEIGVYIGMLAGGLIGSIIAYIIIEIYVKRLIGGQKHGA